NADEWLDMREIIEEDFGLMKVGECETLWMKILGWSKVEGEEGEYDFGWVDEMMEGLGGEGGDGIVGTGRGGRGGWV
ncbi:beta-galactosidase, partial [Bacillus pumilus]|uniref:beta-galactosidase n=1 Tax=Bacillus pumilus TaxID=1408 RepID=UPI0016425DB6